MRTKTLVLLAESPRGPLERSLLLPLPPRLVGTSGDPNVMYGSKSSTDDTTNDTTEKIFAVGLAIGAGLAVNSGRVKNPIGGNIVPHLNKICNNPPFTCVYRTQNSSDSYLEPSYAAVLPDPLVVEPEDVTEPEASRSDTSTVRKLGPGPLMRACEEPVRYTRAQ